MSATKDPEHDDIARRCTICAQNWPDDVQYKTCPECEGDTFRARNVTPMSEEEAHSLKAHAEFERFYEEWDSEKPAERLLSDVV